jgi:hypothetical protein
VKGAETASFGPYSAATRAAYTYAIARRISDPDAASRAPPSRDRAAYLQDFAGEPAVRRFRAVLFNERAKVIESCPAGRLSRQSPLLGMPAEVMLFGGRLRDRIPPAASPSHRSLLISVRRFPAFPTCAS